MIDGVVSVTLGDRVRSRLLEIDGSCWRRERVLPSFFLEPVNSLNALHFFFDETAPSVSKEYTQEKAGGIIYEILPVRASETASMTTSNVRHRRERGRREGIVSDKGNPAQSYIDLKGLWLSFSIVGRLPFRALGLDNSVCQGTVIQ